MSSARAMPQALLAGPLADRSSLPISLSAILGDLRPRFIPKARAGRGFRAIARNGRVLLASDLPVEELTGRAVRVRVQTWHKVILAGDPPLPFGLLLCVHQGAGSETPPALQARLAPGSGERDSAAVHLSIDVGGGQVLEFISLST